MSIKSNYTTTLIFITFFQTLSFVSQGQAFITQWNLATVGSGATQLSFGTATSGIATYTWQEVSPGSATGSGSWSGGTLTITGLPAGAIIRLQIAPANFQRIIIDSGTDRERLTLVEQWGSTAWTSMISAFSACTNLQVTATDLPNLSSVVSLRAMFNGCTNLNSPSNINTWNTGTVGDMSFMFSGAHAFNQNIGAWNTASVTSMSVMFQDAIAFNQNIGSWNTAAVTNMSSMFLRTSAFNQNIGSWNTGAVTDMSFMFLNASAFNQNIGSWNTAAVNTMPFMFASANTFNGNIGPWNTTAVTDMAGMFAQASSFNQNIGSWNTAAVTNMSNMFSRAIAFNQNIGAWNTGAVTDMSNMFAENDAFNQNIGAWDTGAVTDMGSMFYQASAFNQNIGTWNVNGVTTMRDMFYLALAFNQNIGAWDVGSVTDMEGMFTETNAFNQNIGSWNTGAVTSMQNMFDRATAFNQNLGAWTLKPGVDLRNMFDDSGMDCNNYSTTLIGWSTNPATPDNLLLGAIGIQYGTNAAAERTNLTTTKGWTITGDSPSGAVCVSASLPTITNFTPISGPIATQVTITGTNFSTTPTNNNVRFNGTTAVVTASTATSITTSVPANATTGLIDVTVGGTTATSTDDFTVTPYVPAGNVVQLNGATDLIEIPDNVALQPQSFTLEAWVNFSSTSSTVVILGKAWAQPSVENSYAIYQGGGTLYSIINNTSTTAPWTPVINTWNHVALTYDNDTQTQALYLNGTAVTSAFTPAPIQYSAGNISIGSDIDFNNPSGFFQGKMDEVRIWNVIRTEAEIQATLNQVLVGNEPGLVAYYNMDEIGQGAGINVQNSATATGAALNGTTRGTLCTPIFTVLPTTITSFAPNSGLPGSTLTITGTNFTGITEVRFNGTPTTSFTVVSATSITATLPTGVSTGPISITAGCNTATSSSNFTISIPTITSFSPASGAIGTTVIITGTNFDSTPANNVVYFGATRATVTAATSTQLTVTVPVSATYQPISVTTSALTAFSAKPFNTTFCSTPDINAGSFAAPINFTTGPTSGPVSIAIGDLDGDGETDVAVANRFANTVSVFRNTSSGSGNISFASKVDLTITGSEPISATITDLDGDGKLDLAVAVFGSAIISAFRNTSSGPGTITFATKTDFSTGFSGAGPFAVTFADLDGDGKTDLAVANSLSNQMGLLRNASSGAGTINFAIPIYFYTGAGTGPISIAASDLDGDGKIDLTTSNANTNTISVFRNTSTSSINFDNRQVFSAGVVPRSVAIGDLDSDDKPDLAVTSQSNLVSIFLNTSSAGSISLETAKDFSTGVTPWFVTISDLNGDGKPDLATANEVGSGVSVLRNSSNGAGNLNFSSPVDFIGTNGMVAVSSGDFDNDGKSDLVSALFNEDVISVFRNTIAAPSGTPTVASFTPASGPIGASVTITGTNFDSTPANNTVRFNGVTATIIASTATSITVTVPAGATSGPISVTVGCAIITSTSNFTITTLNSITISSQPIASTVCEGTTASFTIAASGTTTIIYQWQKLNGTVFSDVTNGGGYSGATSTLLNVNTTGNFGTGDYRCKVSGDLAADVFSATVTLSVNPIPTAPSSPVNESSCAPRAFTLSVSGGTNGQYRWYTAATGGTALSGEVNNTFTTPALTTTTPYYVAIDNGTCESTRTLVAATINTPPPAPTTTGASGCAATSFTLTASGGVSGQYRWYTLAAGETAIVGEVNSTYTTPVLTTTTTYYVSINNGTCESTRTSITVTVQPCATNQPPAIATTTIQAPINGRVTISLAALLSDPDNNLNLATLRVTVPPVSGASASVDAQGNLILDYSGISFSGIERLTIEVCDLLGVCTQQELNIEVVGGVVVFNAVSPNNDGRNEVFLIQYIDDIEATRENHVFIYNRWGDLVFDVTDYDNKTKVFKGINNKGNELSSGTYFYKIEFESGQQTLTGYLTLKR